MIKHIDSKKIALIFKKDQMISYLVDLFYQRLDKALKEKDRFNVALSGGSTPKILYSAICSDPRAQTADFSKVYCYFGDERAVALDHEESNYHMALEAGFKHLKNIHILPMPAYKKDPKAASEYEKHLPTHLDLIFLGMGDDGHTASLFPDDPMVKIQDRHVCYGHVACKQADRMSLTLPYINLSSHIVILVTGRSKNEMIKRVLKDHDTSLPVYHVGTTNHPAYFVLDEDAASLI